MALTLVQAPTLSALTVDEAKLHLRVSSNAEDTLITALIEAATQECEQLTQRAILAQDWRLTLDQWPSTSGTSSVIELPRGRVTAVKTVTYVDAATGNTNTLAGTEYQLDGSSDYMGRLMPAYGKTWPQARLQLAAVAITFTAGWPTAAEVPQLIKAWLKLRIGALYENREAWTQGKAIERNPFTDRLLDRYCLLTA
jgi:uncharacterized phiE125 gp8 family phage protein